jgi:hypothetical protein
MKQLKFIDIQDGNFTLWDKPNNGTQAFVFSQEQDPNDPDALRLIEIEEAFILEDERHIIAAGLAMSNLGFEVEVERILDLAEGAQMSYSTRLAMESLTGHLSENEAMDEMFVGEAESWHETIKELTVNELVRVYGGDRHGWIEQLILQD